MRRKPSARVSSEGVTHTQLAIQDCLGWLFREQPTEDFGVDAHAEIVDGESVQGRLLALQIKSGESFFREPGAGGWWFRPDVAHVQYWLNHSLPVVLVLYRPKTKKCHWQLVNSKTLEKTSTGGWKLWVPESQLLNENAVAPLRAAAEANQIVSRTHDPQLSPVFGVEPPPEPFVARLHIYDRLQAAVKRARYASDANGRLVGVIGMGGAGKTYIARHLAYDKEIRSMFPDGVLWVELGYKCELVSSQLVLLEALGDALRPVHDPAQGRVRLERLLASRSCLIILDNVWDPAHLRHFPLSAGSAVVVTSRNFGTLPPQGSPTIEVGTFTDEESATLLSFYVGQETEHLPVEAHQIAHECDNLPLAVAIAGSLVSNGAMGGWKSVLAKLKNAMLDRLEVPFVRDYPYPNLLAAIIVGLDDLTELEQACYYALAVFDNRGQVPIGAIIRLWDTAFQVGTIEAQDLLELLIRRCFLMRSRADTVVLHDLLADYARQAMLAAPGASGLGQDAISALHGWVADGYVTRWNGFNSDLAGLKLILPGPDQDDRYGLDYLASHLANSNQPSMVHRLLALEWRVKGRPDGLEHSINAWHSVHERTGTIHSYLANLALGRAIAEGETDICLDEKRKAPSVGLEIWYCLLEASMTDIAKAIPSKLLIGLVEHDIWPTKQAISYAERIPNAHARLFTLLKLAPYGNADEIDTIVTTIVADLGSISNPMQQAEVMAELARWSPRKAIEFALNLPSPQAQILVFVAVAESQPDMVLAAIPDISSLGVQVVALTEVASSRPYEVLKISQGIVSPKQRAEVLLAVVRVVRENERRPIVDDALVAIREIADDDRHAEMLATAARYRPEAVLVAASEIKVHALRSSVLTAASRYMPECPERTIAINEAIASARRAATPKSRVRRLVSAVQEFHTDEREHILDEAWEIARKSRDPQALAILAPYRPDSVLAAVSNLADRGAKAALLAEVASYRPIEATTAAVSTIDSRHQAAVLRAAAPYAPVEVIHASRNISSEKYRANVLRIVAPRRPDDVLTESATLREAQRRADLLEDIAPYRPSEVIAALQDIHPPRTRVAAYVAAAAHLPESERSKILDYALALSRQIDDSNVAAHHQARLRIIERLNCPEPGKDPQLRSTLSLVSKIPSKRNQAATLAALAPYLPDQVLAYLKKIQKKVWTPVLVKLAGVRPKQVLAKVSKLANDEDRAEVLIALSDSIPDEVLLSIGDLRTSAHQIDVLEAVAAKRPADVMARIGAVRVPIDHVRLLVAVSVHAGDHRNEILDVAWQVILQIARPSDRGRALAYIAVHRPFEVFAASKEIDDLHQKVDLLSVLVDHLPAPVAELALAELGSALDAMESTVWAEMAPQLARHFPSRLLSNLDEARTAQETILMLRSAAPFRPDQSFALACQLADIKLREQALEAIAVACPTKVLKYLLDASERVGAGRLLSALGGASIQADHDLAWQTFWRPALGISSELGRIVNVKLLSNLATVLVDVTGGPEGPREAVEGLIAVQRWWP